MLIEDHGGALEADLIAHGWTLDDIGVRLPWRTVKNLVEHAGPESSLLAECRPELAGWTPLAMLIAQLIDTVNMLRWENICRNIPKNKPKPRQPKPVPRPGVKQDPEERHYGRDPIPLHRFDDWWEAKRLEKLAAH